MDALGGTTCTLPLGRTLIEKPEILFRKLEKPELERVKSIVTKSTDAKDYFRYEGPSHSQDGMLSSPEGREYSMLSSMTVLRDASGSYSSYLVALNPDARTLTWSCDPPL